MRRLSALVMFVGALFAAFPASASDHADPIWLPDDEQEANITGLFFFPDGDQLIAILNVRRSLTGPPPYHLEPFEYNIFMDLHSKVTFETPEDVARYGGAMVNSETISPDVAIKFLLNNDATVKEKSFNGLKEPDRMRVYAGVRDDPFIFPEFFKVNVITIALGIPKSSFPDNQQDWLLWATTNRVEGGQQIDHVGRSNRSELGRFEFLNTVPPGQHVAAIKDRAGARAEIQEFLKNAAPPLGTLNQLSGFLIRHYDYAPAVMVYANQRPARFPIGRGLQDDAALLTCQQGDCPLQENSFIDSVRRPRATVNDKPFLAAFPYLAEPWPHKPQAPGPWGPYVVRFLTRPTVTWGLIALVPALIISAITSRWHRRAA